MTPNVEQGRRAGVRLGVACLGLLTTSSLAAQEPKLRGTLKGHTESVQSVAFSPDGKTLASASGDRSIKLWDVATGKEQATLKGHTGSVRSVAFSSDSKTLASASYDKTVKLWDVATGKERATLKGHTGMVYSVAFSPDGRMLASAGGSTFGEPGELKVWDVATGK
jgi:WD40 repeat protein